MYDNRRLRFFASQPDIDIHQIIREAQSRWLRPVEVIEILRNYQQFRLNPVPPNKPPSGSLFLFDRKTLRFFRKDGHNWRKKKDGKTVREAHERLKAGSVDVLHCYYAHGEENANFQRRSYWMLEGAYEHIVLVHYREVTEGGRASAYKSIQDASASKETIPVAINQNRPSSSRAASLSDNELTGPYKSPEIPETSATPVCSEEAESADEADETPASETQSSLLNQVSGQSKDLTSVDFDDLLRNPDAYLGQQTQTVTPSVALDISGWNELLENFRGTAATDKGLNFNSPFHKSYTRNNADPNVRSVYSPALPPIEVQQFFKSTETQQMDVDVQQRPIQKDTSNVFEAVDNQDCYRVSLPECAIKQEESTAYKKLDSFGRWMSREIGEDSQSSLISSSEHGAYWATLEDHGTLDEISSFSNHMHLDVGLSPSLSHHQQFSILDFSPDFAFSSEETKVIIAGSFLKGGSESTWYCMFGEIEVPAEVIREGVVRCKAPPHASGRVPLYITRGDRLACSEVREFEYRTPTLTNTKSTSSSSPSSSEYPQDEDVSLQTRFVRLLMDDAAAVSNKSSDTQVPERLVDVCKIRSLTSEVHKDWIDYEKKDHKSLSELTLQTLLKQNLQTWLLSKLYEVGKGTSVLDTQGQGILHMAAALGYDWAISPILSSGVLINFRDIHGWTALHWAAFRGREKVVSTLIAGGANPGLVTDPTPHYPSGRTPADLASTSGHRGMAGYLAELSLTTHLTLLTVKEQSSTNEIDSFSAALAGEKAVELISEKTSIERGGGDEHALLKDSLRAVRNAARAAALIHASFRQESFRRRREKQQGIIVDDEYGMSMEEIRSMTTALHSSSSSSSAGGGGGGKDKLHSAATTIQQKFRGWKGRRDFLLLRRRVVKIQAHVRGHQVRRKFRKFLWTVGILDKAVLRWRRKGAGLRGFRAAAAAAAAATKTTTRSGAKDDDDDDDCCADSEKKEVTSDEDNEVLRAGRKQKEEAIQKAVSRVQSMVRSHEAREQYQRLQEAYLQAVNSDGGAAATVANEDFTMFGGGD